MNTKKIKEIIDLMNENGLTEIEVEQDGMKIKLSKRAQGGIEYVSAPTTGKKTPQKEEAPEAQKEDKNLKEIKAPMVGTFYSASSPEADPYVKVGDVIKKGDVLCIVEAMKLMNEVKAEFGGKIVEVAVENAAPVEFGQVLFRIEAV